MSQFSRFPRRRAGRVLAPVLAPVLAVMLAGPALAAPVGQACGPMQGLSRLTVTGEGQSRIAPDLASVQLGVTTQADSAAEAMRQNSDQQGAVIAALREAGLDEADIQTSGLNLSPLMQYGDGVAPTVTGYQATNLVSIRVADLARLGEVLDAIVAAGANEIQGISFTREDGAEPLDAARVDAVEDARRKAEVLAGAAGLSLGPVLTLRDLPQNDGGPRPMMRMEAAMADASVPVQPGELSMTAVVEIEYALAGEGACAPMQRHGMPHRHQMPEGGMPGDEMPGDDMPGEDMPGDEAPAEPAN